MGEEIKRKMEIQCQERRIKVDQMANTIVMESEATLARANNNSKSLIAVAEAENNSTAGLEVKRKYELEWQRLQIMEKLAMEGRRFVTGEVQAAHQGHGALEQHRRLQEVRRRVSDDGRGRARPRAGRGAAL